MVQMSVKEDAQKHEPDYEHQTRKTHRPPLFFRLQIALLIDLERFLEPKVRHVQLDACVVVLRRRVKRRRRSAFLSVRKSGSSSGSSVVVPRKRRRHRRRVHRQARAGYESGHAADEPPLRAAHRATAAGVAWTRQK
jgi:hypothetical protein